VTEEEPLGDETVEGQAVDASVSLEETIARAEELLFALAIELRAVPVHERTRAVHLRALELKRDVASWRASPPIEDDRTRVFREIETLTREAQAARRSRPQITAARLSERPFASSLPAVARLARRTALGTPLAPAYTSSPSVHAVHWGQPEGGPDGS
jgi:hypothetical protein